jgi:hypothetical protein
VNNDAVVFQIVIPGSLYDQQADIVEAFNAESVEISIVGSYSTKGAADFADAKFWVDLAHHAASYPWEHVIDSLEGAAGLALLRGFKRIRQWAGRRMQILVSLPGTNRQTHYIIPNEPEDQAAIRAIKKHYYSVKENTANEYFWISGEWLNSAEYWKKKRS